MILIDFYELEILWETNRWDGPTAGVAEYKDQWLYFGMKEEEEYNWRIDGSFEFEGKDHDITKWDRVRTFTLYDVPVDVKHLLEKEHRRFEKYVSKDGVLRSYSNHRKFYDNKKDIEGLIIEDWIIGEAIEISHYG